MSRRSALLAFGMVIALVVMLLCFPALSAGEAATAADGDFEEVRSAADSDPIDPFQPDDGVGRTDGADVHASEHDRPELGEKPHLQTHCSSSHHSPSPQPSSASHAGGATHSSYGSPW